MRRSDTVRTVAYIRQSSYSTAFPVQKPLTSERFCQMTSIYHNTKWVLMGTLKRVLADIEFEQEMEIRLLDRRYMLLPSLTLDIRVF